MSTDPNIGRKLFDRYELTEPIGQGSMGRVYRAMDTRLGGVPVAVKFLSQAILTPAMEERFYREAELSAKLGQKSLNIVKVTDYGSTEDDIPFYVMEYLQGRGLNDVISTELPTLTRFYALCRQIGRGLQCAHQGILVDGQASPIIHRDIKPSNILVTQNPTFGELVKILDFGIAKLLQPDGNQTNSFMGTLAYSSPEQMEGEALDARSDIYSLGVMMFQMLTGKLPIRADSHSFGGWFKAHRSTPPRTFKSVRPDLKLPKALATLVMDCLAKQPQDRPQNVGEILRTLEHLEARPAPVEVPSDPAKKQPEKRELDENDVCRLAVWPKTKPVAEIVFPHVFSTQHGKVVTLWVMLPKQDIQNRLICTRYNHFLYTSSPHPTLLWITALYTRQHGPRWLPCYLDLKAKFGQGMVRLLSKVGQYRILCFALEEPQNNPTVMIANVAAPQREHLKRWANLSQLAPVSPQFHVSKEGLKASKDGLKAEFETLKPRILMKLESSYTLQEEVDAMG